MNPSFAAADPPAYSASGPSQQYQWRIKNSKYRSTFTILGQPAIWDFREHLEYMKETWLGYTQGLGSSGPEHDSSLMNVQNSQAFSNIEQLITEYQRCLHSIRPLHEEDVLFLLLSRYANATGADVYLEIRRLSDVQIFDSALLEPYHNSEDPNQGRLQRPRTESQLGSSQHDYSIMPQVPISHEMNCVVSVNFPTMYIVETEHEKSSGSITGEDDPPAYCGPDDQAAVPDI